MSITFPDGYVAPVPGPVIMESIEGYALTDPSPGRIIGLFALPAAGAGLGALIGHSAGKPDSNVTSNFPPGCIGGPPFCTPVTTPVFGTQTQRHGHWRGDRRHHRRLAVHHAGVWFAPVFPRCGLAGRYGAAAAVDALAGPGQ